MLQISDGVTREAMVETANGIKCKKSEIDHFFVRENNCNLWSAKVLKWTMADHYALMVERVVACSDVGPTLQNNGFFVKKINFHLLDQKINETDFMQSLDETDPCVGFSKFHELLQNAVQSSESLTHIRAAERKLKPWITTGIVTSIRRRDKIYKKLKSNPQDYNLRRFYKEYAKQLDKIIQKAKLKYAENQLERFSGNIRKEYKFVKEFLNLPRKGTSVNTSAFKGLTESEIANNFNKHFTNIGRRNLYTNFQTS